MNVIEFVKRLLELLGPDLKAAIVKALDEWEANAAKTPGPIDDIVVAILKWLLGVPKGSSTTT